MQRVETYILTKNKSKKDFQILVDLCHKSKNLYNAANYIVRQVISNKLENIPEYTDLIKTQTKIVKSKKTIIIPYNEIIEEGGVQQKISKSYKRSQKLRNSAIEHFSHNGIIKCDCCGFEFSTYYGDVYGKPGCIELHHLKPIFQYAGISVQNTIDEALKNLLPVCPNCHRVIHKKHISADKIQLFKNEILQNSSY